MKIVIQEEKKNGRGSSSSSSSSSSDSPSDSDDSLSDGWKKTSKQKKSKKDNVDYTFTTKAKRKTRKEIKIQTFTQSVKEGQKGMLDMATKLRELRGLYPRRCTQKQFEEHQKKATGKDDNMPEPWCTDDNVAMEGPPCVQ